MSPSAVDLAKIPVRVSFYLQGPWHNREFLVMSAFSIPSALPWSDHFSVGHETIDAQHREIVEVINGIDDALRTQNESRFGQLLKGLRRAAEEHFRNENAILWQIKTGTFRRRSSKALPRAGIAQGLLTDPVFEQHSAEHVSLLARLDEIATGSTDSMIELLKAWFVDHAIAQDALLKAIFQALS